MYRYDNMDRYYNYNNNNYNIPNFNQVNSNESIYDPYQGFIRGNLFPNLYNSYKIEVPMNIQPINEQAQLLTELDALQFSTIDLNLYLDNYPDDRQMIDLFDQYSKEFNIVKNKYEEKYGPILVYSQYNNKYPWSWNKSPWPWEGN